MNILLEWTVGIIFLLLFTTVVLFCAVIFSILFIIIAIVSPKQVIAIGKDILNLEKKEQ